MVLFRICLVFFGIFQAWARDFYGFFFEFSYFFRHFWIVSAFFGGRGRGIFLVFSFFMNFSGAGVGIFWFFLVLFRIFFDIFGFFRHF